MLSPPPGYGSSAARAKVLSREELLRRREEARRAGRSVVQCHGCFDIVHPGHIRHLRQAKTHGDLLLVSITGDAAWTKRQGAPLIPEELRAENLAELDCVDWVYIEQQPTAEELLAELGPDVYVKGKEYERNSDPRFAAERAAVESRGGRVVFSSGDVVFSSTALIASLERMADPYHAQLGQLLAKPELEGGRLGGVISSFRGKRVLVIGETILDTYWLCDQPEIASESPVMTLRPLERRQFDGGAAIIARHIAAMGGSPTLLTGLPHHMESEALRRRLSAEGVEVESIPTDTSIAEKERFLVGTQKVMKLNNYHPIVLDAERQDRLVDLACERARGFDAAIVVDFGNGLLSPAVIERLGRLLRPLVGVMTGDVSGKRATLRHFNGFDLLAPSEQEARGAIHCFDESLPVVAWRLLEQTRTRHLLLTLGADGLIAFEKRQTAGVEAITPGDLSRVRGEHVPSLVGHAIDPLGCGDSLLAAATLALTVGQPAVVGAFLGTVAAAAQAQRLGNVPISATDLRHGVARAHAARLVYADAREPSRPAMELRAS
jgi:rfaE bifunctional protein nucleotidyltransferase chain/domain